MKQTFALPYVFLQGALTIVHFESLQYSDQHTNVILSSFHPSVHYQFLPGYPPSFPSLFLLRLVYVV